MTMLSVTGVLVVIFMCNQFVRYLGDAAIGRLTLTSVLQMMCIQVPLLLGFMLPLGLFLGILLAFGRLYTDNEMTVLTACGVSPNQILGMSLKFACFVTAIIAILMLLVEPKMAWYRDHIIAKAAISSPIERISPGQFQAVGKWVLYTEGLSRDRQKMENVFAAQIPEKFLEQSPNHPSLDIVTAAKAFQKTDKTHNSFIVLSQGYRYVGSPGHNNYQLVKFAEYGVRLPNKVPPMRRLEEFMSFGELWKDRRNPLAAAELQWRLAMPISALILTLFAVPLSQVHPRYGRFTQLLPAVIIYIIYIDLLFLAQAWIEKGRISTTLGMWWIHGLMLLMALMILAYKLSWFKKRPERVS